MLQTNGLLWYIKPHTLFIGRRIFHTRCGQLHKNRLRRKIPDFIYVWILYTTEHHAIFHWTDAVHKPNTPYADIRKHIMLL